MIHKLPQIPDMKIGLFFLFSILHSCGLCAGTDTLAPLSPSQWEQITSFKVESVAYGVTQSAGVVMSLTLMSQMLS